MELPVAMDGSFADALAAAQNVQVALQIVIERHALELRQLDHAQDFREHLWNQHFLVSCVPFIFGYWTLVCLKQRAPVLQAGGEQAQFL